jgi:hypothetical protein
MSVDVDVQTRVSLVHDTVLGLLREMLVRKGFHKTLTTLLSEMVSIIESGFFYPSAPFVHCLCVCVCVCVCCAPHPL